MALVLVDCLYYGLINPTKAYALVVVGGFALLIVNIYVGMTLLLMLVRRVVPLSIAVQRRVRAFTTAILGVLMAMQSIGQLTVKDLLALVPLVVVLLFYLSYQKRARQRA